MSKRKVIVTIARKGMAHKSQNAHLPTERIVRIILELDMEPATRGKARELMGLPRKNAVRPEFAVRCQ